MKCFCYCLWCYVEYKIVVTIIKSCFIHQQTVGTVKNGSKKFPSKVADFLENYLTGESLKKFQTIQLTGHGKQSVEVESIPNFHSSNVKKESQS